MVEITVCCQRGRLRPRSVGPAPARPHDLHLCRHRDQVRVSEVWVRYTLPYGNSITITIVLNLGRKFRLGVRANSPRHAPIRAVPTRPSDVSELKDVAAPLVEA